jgi:uncharacterized protein
MIKKGPIELLIIQGTPFCNIDCDYCYLPNRSDKSKISIGTIEKIAERLFESDLVQSNFSLVWHCGEPLVLPISFYEKVLSIFESRNNTQFRVTHSFQTNGTLINQQWCDFFLENNIEVAISLDGHKYLHDLHRFDRKQNGTFSRVMNSVELLKLNRIDFGIIAVVSAETLKYANEFYDFFYELNPRRLGINIEEVEAYNESSTLLDATNLEADFAGFINQLLIRYYKDNRKLKIREFIHIEDFISKSTGFASGFGQLNFPYKTINIDTNGNFSTFSPELITTELKDRSFVFGNVFNDSFESALNSDEFLKTYSEILKGLIKCKSSCEYFSVCGGGSPSNKLAENGTFDSKETKYCRLRRQIIFDLTLKQFEEYLDTHKLEFK